MTNIINLTDSYKFSHYNQYPKGTEIVHSYLAPRGGEYDDVVVHGLNYIIKEYLSIPVPTIEEIQGAECLAQKHGVPFNKEGWLYINKLGYLPIEIKALEEGSIVGNKTPILTLENTDENCAWLVGYLETLLLKIWYPITIASKSYSVKKTLLQHWENTAECLDGVDFSYHNFGDRGSSSVESAAIGGVAHLTQFKGTDNFNALNHSLKYYGGKYWGFSIPATEHSTVTSFGREGEFSFYETYLETYKSSNLIACVMDSYNVFEATNFVTSGDMKSKIESEEYPTWVLRPDSGNPVDVITKMLKIMNQNDVAFSINSKGYKVFNKYRILWGDGITQQQIDNILTHFTGDKFKMSAENFAFGLGGNLMQNVSRDTLKFAMKCSAIKVNGEWRDVFKDPITDSGKRSITGRVLSENLKTVFKNGQINF